MTKNDVISEKLHFHFLGEYAYSKLESVKTMGTGGYVDMNCQQLCKISREKNLTEVKIFQKVLGGYLFFKHPVHYATIHGASDLN